MYVTKALSARWSILLQGAFTLLMPRTKIQPYSKWNYLPAPQVWCRWWGTKGNPSKCFGVQFRPSASDSQMVDPAWLFSRYPPRVLLYWSAKSHSRAPCGRALVNSIYSPAPSYIDLTYLNNSKYGIKSTSIQFKCTQSKQKKKKKELANMSSVSLTCTLVHILI